MKNFKILFMVLTFAVAGGCGQDDQSNTSEFKDQILFNSLKNETKIVCLIKSKVHYKQCSEIQRDLDCSSSICKDLIDPVSLDFFLSKLSYDSGPYKKNESGLRQVDIAMELVKEGSDEHQKLKGWKTAISKSFDVRDRIKEKSEAKALTQVDPLYKELSAPLEKIHSDQVRAKQAKEAEYRRMREEARRRILEKLKEEERKREEERLNNKYWSCSGTCALRVRRKVRNYSATGCGGYYKPAKCYKMAVVNDNDYLICGGRGRTDSAARKKCTEYCNGNLKLDFVVSARVESLSCR